MKIFVCRTNDCDDAGDYLSLLEQYPILRGFIVDEDYIEINTLEQLFDLPVLLDEEIIVTGPKENPAIEIYNDYRE